MAILRTTARLLFLIGAATVAAPFVSAQEQLPWQKPYVESYRPESQADVVNGYPEQGVGRYASPSLGRDDRAPNPYGSNGAAQPPRVYNESRQAYQAPAAREPYDPAYGAQPRSIQPYPRTAPATGYRDDYPSIQRRQYGSEPPGYDQGRTAGYDDRRLEPRPGVPDPGRTTYSRNEIVNAGHRFFGSLSSGLAKAIEYVFKQSGRPNGYILGEDAGGAFVAGLRYGEGRLYTKHAGTHRVFWQGPSIGYDFGGDGTRTMTLVYNLRSSRDIYRRFAGVQGSAYLVGGASVQLLKASHVTLAPIRTGVGLRLGANIGYLKYTRRPTWNPF